METTYNTVMEKYSSKTKKFIMLEEVTSNEGKYYHVIINDWVKFSGDNFEEAKLFYQKNLGSIV